MLFFGLGRAAPTEPTTKAAGAVQGIPAAASRILAEATFTTAVGHG